MTAAERQRAEAQRHELTRGLVGHEPELRQRYSELPEFRYGIDMLAQVLPIFVESLATYADEQAKAREAQRRLMESMPGPTIFTDFKADQ